MYKVFFNDKAVFLTDDFSRNFQQKYGLFFKFHDQEGLKEILDIYSRLTRIKSLTLFHFNIEVLRDTFRTCFKQIDAAGGVVKNAKGEYLFIYRRGKWDLPKGKVDKGESFAQAAIREVSEETGLSEIELARPLMSTYHTYPLKGKNVLKKTYWFEMEYSGDDLPVPQAEEDIEEVKWFGPGELFIPFQNTYPLIKDLFRYLGYIT